MKTTDPEELLRSYDCKVIDGKVYFEQKYAVNAMNEFTASLQSDLLSLNSNLLTMAENVDLAVKERDRLKETITSLEKESIFLANQLRLTKIALSTQDGLLTNIRHEIDYLPDSYYGWIDRVQGETDEYLPNDDDLNTPQP